MDSSTTVAPARGIRPALAVAASASAMAGLVHAAAASTHEGDSALALMFVLAAMAQLLWAAAVVLRPIRPVLVAGVVINAGAVLVWGLSRTFGIWFVDSLAGGDAVGSQDLTAALFGAASALAAARMLSRPAARVIVGPVWASAFAVIALVAALPALAADHTHDADDHQHVEAADHDHGAVEVAAGHVDGHGDGEVAAGETHDGHDSTDTTSGASHDGHDSTGTTAGGSHDGHDSTGTTVGGHDGHTSTTLGGGGHDHTTTTVGGHDHSTTTTTGDLGPIISLDDPRLTPEQRAAAIALIDATTAGMAPYTSEAAVLAAGYTSIGDGGSTGYEHFVKWSYLTDAYELDPNRIESIVLKKNGDGTKTVVSAMYILSLGKTMDDAPDIAGELTTWHYHDNLCLQGTKLVALAVNGVCPVGTLIVTPPMMHVWMVEHPCGPFAGIDEHGVQCGSHDGH